ncbi:MAG TPA: hypothetical protein VN682_04350 [Terriglobales bacterium]|nr:hypothetical protein [Terriglobales bacterium]
MPEENQTRSGKNIQLLRRALKLFHSHWREISRLLLPPSAFAYAFGWAADQQITQIRKTFHENLLSLAQQKGFLGIETAALPLQAWFLLKQWLIWICYCFALVGVCVLVARMKDLNASSYGSEFSVIREHPANFLKSATLFFLVLAIAFVGMIMIVTGTTELQLQFKIPFFIYESPVVWILSMALISAVIVRWILAVPIATLIGLPFRKALRLSDQLTDGVSIPLWICVMESEIVGYIAAILPFWLAAIVLSGASLTKPEYYIIEVFSFISFALSQAPLMISIGLILEEKRIAISPNTSLAAELSKA